MNDINITDHLGLVHKVAKQLIRRVKDKTVDYDDIYQVGCIGLIQAAERFKPESGVEFSTFAVPTIKGTILKYINQHCHDLRYPVQTVLLANKIKQDNYEEETPEVIAEKYNISLRNAKQVLEYLHKNILYIDSPTQDAPSMHETIGRMGDYTEIEVQEFIDRLQPRQREILNWSYQGYSQVEIANISGTSRANIFNHFVRIRERHKRTM